jgi:hypothetical protein
LLVRWGGVTVFLLFLSVVPRGWEPARSRWVAGLCGVLCGAKCFTLRAGLWVLFFKCWRHGLVVRLTNRSLLFL